MNLKSLKNCCPKGLLKWRSNFALVWWVSLVVVFSLLTFPSVFHFVTISCVYCFFFWFMILHLANLWSKILILLSYNWITGFGSDLDEIRDLGQPDPNPSESLRGMLAMKWHRAQCDRAKVTWWYSRSDVLLMWAKGWCRKTQCWHVKECINGKRVGVRGSLGSNYHFRGFFFCLR